MTKRLVSIGSSVVVAVALTMTACLPCGLLARPEEPEEPTAVADADATATPAAVATELPPPTEAPAFDSAALTALERFLGEWDTDWGPLTLWREGDAVVGEYQYQEGSERITGHVELALADDGEGLEGTWAQPPSYEPPEDAGRVVFAVTDDGQTLEGRWWYGEDQGGGPWIGSRLEATAASLAARERTGDTGFVLSSNSDNDLLFYLTNADGSRTWYYGLGSGGQMRLSHLVHEDAGGEQVVIIYSRDLLPIQWILPEATIATYPRDDCAQENLEDGWGCFDPRETLYVAAYAEEELQMTADIYPADLQAVVGELEVAAGTRLEMARAFLDAHDVTWEELVALAQTEGPEQGRYITAAAAFSGGAAALGLMEAAGAVSAAPRSMGLAAPLRLPIAAPWTLPLEVALDMLLGELLGDWLNPDPGDGPMVDVLLCRGMSSIPQVCHYMFYHRSRLSECVSQCLTSLGCFSDICMPTQISAGFALRVAR